MDQSGNIIVKRLSNCNVFIRGSHKDSSSSSSDDINESNSDIEPNKPVTIFDMKKFQSNVNRELKLTYPNRRKLENQCICAIVFVKDTSNLLDASSWILLINIVALDLLKSRLPVTCYGGNFSSPEMKLIPRFNSGYNSRFITSDEDPYSILMPSTNSTSTASSDDNKKLHSTSNSSSNTSSRESIAEHHKPPALPPRDFTKSKKTTKNRFGIRSLVKSNSNGKLNQLSQDEINKNYGKLLKLFILLFF